MPSDISLSPENIRQLVLRIRYPHTKPDIASE